MVIIDKNLFSLKGHRRISPTRNVLQFTIHVLQFMGLPPPHPPPPQPGRASFMVIFMTLARRQAKDESEGKVRRCLLCFSDIFSVG